MKMKKFFLAIPLLFLLIAFSTQAAPMISSGSTVLAKVENLKPLQIKILLSITWPGSSYIGETVNARTRSKTPKLKEGNIIVAKFIIAEPGYYFENIIKVRYILLILVILAAIIMFFIHLKKRVKISIHKKEEK